MDSIWHFIGMDKVAIALVVAFFYWQTRTSQRP